MKQLLRQLITISRPTYTNSANMGISQTFSPIYENIAASVQPASSSIQFFYAQRQQSVTQTVFVAGTLDLLPGDKITSNGITLQVIGWRDLAGRGKVTAVDCIDFLNQESQ